MKIVMFCSALVLATRPIRSSAFISYQAQTISRTFSALKMSEATVSAVDIALNLSEVRDRIQAATDKDTGRQNNVQLVAVSKTKPLELLQACYDENQRHFGENYAQELIEKAALMPSDVSWHYIGTLQSNKANGLIKGVVPRAVSLTIETVSTLKLAKKLNTAMQEFNDKTLNIFVQVNTSGEESKGGVEPNDVVALCQEITESCDKLVLKGLMTIGAVGDLGCFDVLVECRAKVSNELGIDMDDLALSMGMSGDFEEAIARGATHVRVGSTIFGARDYSKK